jgi:hypothetical protein
MQIKVGKLYRVKLSPVLLKEPIKKASEALLLQHTHYSDLNDQTIIVLAAKKSRNGHNVKAGLLDKNNLPIDDQWFTISSRWLTTLPQQSCVCNTKILMCRGCICGAFDYEQSDPEPDLKLKPNFEPW